MKAKLHVIALALLSAPLVGANSSGPVRLLSCVVSRTGLLEAEVTNASDSALTCKLRCDYVIRESTTASHVFEATIPPRYHGKVGQLDTSSGRPGSYSGRVDACQRKSGRTTRRERSSYAASMDYGFGRPPRVPGHKSEPRRLIADAVLGVALAIVIASLAS